MASLIEKVQILLAADLNRLVDRALQSNEPALFQHHIRELQTMQEELGAQLVSVRAGITAMRRRSDEAQALAVKQDGEVDALLRLGVQEDALAAQDRLNATRSRAATLTAQVDNLEAQYAELIETKARLDARITALQQQEPEVSSLVGTARAQMLADQAGARLDDLEAGPAAHDADTARVVDSIRQRLAQAEARVQDLESHALAHGETPEVLKRKELEGQLEARKARLGMAEPPAPPAPVAVAEGGPALAPEPGPEAPPDQDPRKGAPGPEAGTEGPA
jgi:phage shock protein A